MGGTSGSSGAYTGWGDPTALSATKPTDGYYLPNWIVDWANDKHGASPANYVNLTPGTNYQLYDRHSGKVVASGSTPEEFTKMMSLVNDKFTPMGHSSDWQLLREGTGPRAGVNPRLSIGIAGGRWITGDDGQKHWYDAIGGDYANSSALKTILPVAAAIISGGLLLGPTAAAGAAGASAAGSTAGALGTAAGVTSPSVLGAGALGATLPSAAGISSALGAAGLGATGLGGAALGGLGAITGALAPEIVVTGATGGLGTLGTLGTLGAVGGATGALTGAGGATGGTSGGTSGGTTAGGTTGDPITVVGSPGVTSPSVLGAGSLAGLTAEQISAALQQAGVTTPKVDGEVNSGFSTYDKIRAALKAAGLLGNLFGGSGSGSGTQFPGGGFGSLSDAFTDNTLPAPNIPGLQHPGQRNMTGTDWEHYGEGPEKSFFNGVPQGLAHGGQPRAPTYESLTPQEREVIDYTRRGMATGIIQRNPDKSLTSFKGAVEDFPDGTIRYFPTFWNGHELPLDAARDRAARSGIDWPQYPSYGAGLSREAQIHRLMEQEANAYQAGDRRMLEGYSHGGPLSDRAVAGPGSGRDDKIPAMLSDGEYIMDAETVALLGDGSNKAGAQKLDKLRVNIRKHKGRALARGGFSANAKPADAYLGGRNG